MIELVANDPRVGRPDDQPIIFRIHDVAQFFLAKNDLVNNPAVGLNTQ